MLADDGTVQNNPLTVARNDTRKGMHLPTIPQQAQSVSTYALEDSDAGTGIDTSCVDAQALSDLLSDKTVANAIDNAEESFYASLMPQPNNQMKGSRKMNDDQQYVSFDRLVSQKLSEQLADANRQIATLAAMCDIKDAQIAELRSQLENKDDGNGNA